MQKFQTQPDNNHTSLYLQMLTYQRVLDNVNLGCYLFICLVGLAGNGLVIYVVLTYAKMKTVTNIYILNLAVTDLLFLIMLPVTATTVIMKHWVFGQFMCKVYFVLCAVNIFGGAFNLCLMSVDRYLAVCHPILSLRHRTPGRALCLCICVWILTFLVMLPVIMYTTTVKHRTLEDKYSCRIDWSSDRSFPADTAFVWYSFILGFIIPVTCISVLYIMIIARLHRVGAARKCKGTRRSHSRVTWLILCVITVYVVCWLPHWCLQIHAAVSDSVHFDTSRVLLVNSFTILSYANNMLNPLLYAFLSDNFRQSFLKAFKCLSSFRIARFMYTGNSVIPSRSHLKPEAVIEDNVGLSLMNRTAELTQESGQSPLC